MLGPVHTGCGAAPNRQTKIIMIHTAVNGSVHTAYRQNEWVCTQKAFKSAPASCVNGSQACFYVRLIKADTLVRNTAIALTGSPVPSLKLELQKVTPEPFYAVPHKPDKARELCAGAVNVFWEKRRYGESWDNLAPPDNYYGTSRPIRIRSFDGKYFLGRARL